MQKQNELKLHDPPAGSPNLAATIPQRAAVRILRQLENELMRINRMESLTLQLNQLIRGKALEKLTSLEFVELETIADQISGESEAIRSGRQMISSCLAQTRGPNDSALSVRAFISLAAEPLRGRLHDVRISILEKSHVIRAMLSSSHAVIFYSVNTYRQFLEGLMDIKGSEGQYRADGPPVVFPTGRLLRKTC